MPSNDANGSGATREDPGGSYAGLLIRAIVVTHQGSIPFRPIPFFGYGGPSRRGRCGVARRITRWSPTAGTEVAEQLFWGTASIASWGAKTRRACPCAAPRAEP